MTPLTDRARHLILRSAMVLATVVCVLMGCAIAVLANR